MATPEGTTIDGYEIQFGTNHMGHALFLEILRPALQRTSDTYSPARIVWLGSAAHSNAPAEGIWFDTLRGSASEVSTWTRYGQSKLASILYSFHFAKMHPQFTMVVVHPGMVNSNLASHSFWMRTVKLVASVFLLSVEDGAKNTLWAATSNSAVSGEYYEPIGVAGQGTPQTRDLKLEEEIWNWTQSKMKPPRP